jgi:hypothetical protein
VCGRRAETGSEAGVALGHDGATSSPAKSDPGYGLQKAASIGMLRCFKNFFRSPELDDGALFHYRYFMSEGTGNRYVMRNHQV